MDALYTFGGRYCAFRYDALCERHSAVREMARKSQGQSTRVGTSPLLPWIWVLFAAVVSAVACGSGGAGGPQPARELTVRRADATPEASSSASPDRDALERSAQSGAEPVAHRRSTAPDVGSHDLAADERRGGHTLERHVGRSDADLRARLARERQVSAASTYSDRETAERVVAVALAQGRRRLEGWLDRDGGRPNLVLEYHGPPDAAIGRSVRRGTSSAVPCHDAIVVLRWIGGRDYYVLTSYPEAKP